MTTIGAVAVPGVGAKAPAARFTRSVYNSAAVTVTLTGRALEALLHLAVCREASMSSIGDADSRETVAVCEAIRALQEARRMREGDA